MEILKETAIGVIKEWGVDCDNYVACNYHQYLHDGVSSDNSRECADYFLGCLRIVIDLGLQREKP